MEKPTRPTYFLLLFLCGFVLFLFEICCRTNSDKSRFLPFPSVVGGQRPCVCAANPGVPGAAPRGWASLAFADVERNDVIERFGKGESVAAVARVYKVSRQSIIRIRDALQNCDVPNDAP